MVAAAVLALHGLIVFLLLPVFYLGPLMNVGQGREYDVLGAVKDPGRQFCRRCSLTEQLALRLGAN